MKLSLEKLENRQIWIYIITLIVAGILGLSNHELATSFEGLISLFIMVLMFVMFLQIPFLKVREALANFKFMIALLIGNFIAIPILVWILLLIFPQSPPVLVGVCLVLLTPCIDYVIAFTKLGKGDEKLILAATPILFLMQMILLPFYLWVFIGEGIRDIVQVQPFIDAFILFIVAPLILAVLTQVTASHIKESKKVLNFSAWLPVPIMALVLFTVVVSQIGQVYSDLDIVISVIPVYILFLIFSPMISKVVANLFKLNVYETRALAFSAGTRNSLVVLPLALALPGEWSTLAAAVIITQTLIELIGELFYIKVIPRFISNR